MFDNPLFLIAAGVGIVLILIVKGYIKLPASVTSGLKKSGQEAASAASDAKLSVEDLASALVDLIKQEEQQKQVENAKTEAIKKIREAVSPTSPELQEGAGKAETK